MGKYSDIKRSFMHFKKHQKLNYLNLTITHKFILSFVWIFLLPTVIFELLSKKKTLSTDVFVLEYTDNEPYHTIYRRLRQDTKYRFVSLCRYYFPRLPLVFVKDIGMLLIREPLFLMKNLYFLGALSLKISHYNHMIYKYNINYLIVFQEYSFYSSYLTHMIENKEGKIYNIQHGIPGDTYSFFRFSKCFIWGEYYKKKYIQNKACSSQFILSGSIFHDSIVIKKKKEYIDILYIMQGYVGNKEDILSILLLLEKLSVHYTVRILQHPRHKISIPYNLIEYEGQVIEGIECSKVILSQYSTAMLDATYIGKESVSFIGNNIVFESYVNYLPKHCIVKKFNLLEEILITQLNKNKIVNLDNKYIDKTKNPIEIIEYEINQDIFNKVK